MNSNQETSRRKITAFFKMVLAVWTVGVCGQVALGQNLIKNGDFSDGLSDWKTVGDVTAGINQAILTENGDDPLIYQAVPANGYAYELRFDVDLAGLSDRAGSGEFDSVSLVLYEGMDANDLTPDSAVAERILIQGNASGLTALVPDAQIAPNPVLGLFYVSVVVEFTSDFLAVAPGAELINQNGLIDSEIRISNVRLVQLDRGRLSNISNRGAVGTGPNRMIASFVLSGPDRKSVVVRGAGPWLGDLGVTGFLEDPSMELKNFSTGSVISSNDDWEVGNNKTELIDAMTRVGAWIPSLPLKDGSKDSALFQNEGGGLEAGQYSVVIGGLGQNPTGIAIAEIFDYDVFTDGTTELVNISNRGNTSKGAGAQIPGFVITGDRGRVVLIRVVGPSLAAFVAGTLDDPLLILTENRGAEGNVEVMRNDDYYLADNAAQIVATGTRIGAFDLLPNEKDSAILIGLQPGIYTAQAQVKNDTDSGIVLVEVYVVADNTRPQAATHVVFVSTSGTTILPMDQVLSPLQDEQGDILSVSSYSQPGHGSVDLNEDGELEYTNEIGFVGQTIFNYTVTDGEFESATGVIGLNVAPPGAQIWTGDGSNGSFSNPDNWAGGVVPGATDDVWIVPQGATDITLDQDTQLKSLRIGGIGSDVTFKNSFRNLVTTGSTIVGFGSTYELNGGSIDTGDNFIINGKLKWTAGQMKGNATTIIEPGGVAELSSGQLALAEGRDFLNRGKVIQSGNSYLYSIGGSDSTVTNAAMAQWDVNSTSSRFAYTDGNSSLHYNNAGDLYKSAVSGDVIYGWSSGNSSFTNQATGRVMIQGGSLNFQAAGIGSHSGELMIAEGAEALFTYGSHTFNSGSVISDTGTLNVSTSANVTIASANILESLKISNGGTLNHSGTLTVTEYTQTGGTLNSDDSLVVTGTLVWSGGIQDGEGTTLLENSGTGTLNTTTLTLNGNRAFTNHGELTQLGNALLYPQGGSQSVVTNANDGIWNLNLANNRYAAYADASSRLDFDNAGTMNKQNNLHLYYIGHSQGTSNFSNTGTVNVPSGVLQFEGSGAGTHDGEFVIASGAEIKINRGTHTFGEDALISDTGTLHIAGVGAASMPNALSLESLKISAGTLNAGDAITASDFEQAGGIFVSSSDLIVTDTLTVTGGTQDGDGDTILDAEGEGTLTGSRWMFTSNRNFTNRGMFTLSANSGFDGRSGSLTTITNAVNATMTSNLAANQYVVFSNDTSTTTNFVNDGTFIKANLVGINYIGWSTRVTNFTNSSTGKIEVTGGTLQFWGAGSSTHSGMLTIAANAEVYFQVGNHSFLSGSTVTDSGTLHIGSSNVSVAEGLTIPNLKLSGSQGGLTSGGDLTVEIYEQTQGTLNSSSDITVSDEFSWSGGIQTGSGTTIIGSEATAVLGSTILYMRGNRKFLNNGALTQNAGAYLYADQSSQASATNAASATWTLNSNNNTRFAYNSNDSAMTFTNSGMLSKANSGTTFFGSNGGTSTFVNSATGEIDVTGGVLWFDGSGPGTHQGTLNVSEFATVNFRYGAHAFATGATINADATLIVENNANTSLSFAQAVSFDTLQMKNGTVTNTVDIGVNTFTQSNGRVSGSANLTVAGMASLSGGVQSGGGALIFDTDATVNHTGLIYLESGRKVENRGTYQLSGNGYYSARGGLGASTVTNGSGASWTITGTRLVNNDSSSSIIFINDGTLTKTSANNTAFGTSSGLSTFTNNATLEIQAGSFQFGNASTANFVGGSTARLTTNGGTTKVIDGSGTINFGGTLEVLLSVGFIPTNGQTIVFIDYGRDKGTGTFATHSAPAGYSSLTPAYNYSANPGNLEITFNQ